MQPSVSMLESKLD